MRSRWGPSFTSGWIYPHAERVKRNTADFGNVLLAQVIYKKTFDGLNIKLIRTTPYSLALPDWAVYKGTWFGVWLNKTLFKIPVKIIYNN